MAILLGKHDTLKTRQDMRDQQLNPELWPQGPANHLPPAPYVMPASGLQAAQEWLRGLKVPSAAGLDPSRCFSTAQERAGRNSRHSLQAFNSHLAIVSLLCSDICSITCTSMAIISGSFTLLSRRCRALRTLSLTGITGCSDIPALEVIDCGLVTIFLSAGELCCSWLAHRGCIHQSAIYRMELSSSAESLCCLLCRRWCDDSHAAEGSRLRDPSDLWHPRPCGRPWTSRAGRAGKAGCRQAELDLERIASAFHLPTGKD